MEYQYIDTDQALRNYLQRLKEQSSPALAVDIEGEYNLHCYGEHLCLVQIYDGSEYVLIDPLKVDIQLIKQLFEDPKTLKIFYDCSGDRTLMFRKYNINIKGIFDLMPAVEILDFPKKNLNHVLHEVLGLELKPKKKFQQYNWMTRPIDKEALIYAIEDVQYLFKLKDELVRRILELGKLDDFILKNLEAQTREILKQGIPGAFKKPRFRKMKKAQQEQFKAFFHYREGIAKELNWPANSVVSNDDLFRLAAGELGINRIRFSPRIKPGIKGDLIQEFQKILNA